ncbi:MAG: hypothetical protein Q8P18_24315 [Pseudomonadota bacterium]|nr:hypothetical protein [Pseudomonadota bacterium]
MPCIFLMAWAGVGFAAELVEGEGSSPPAFVERNAYLESSAFLDSGVFLESGGWLAEGGLVTMPDAVGAEATLTRFQVDTGQASVVSADVRRAAGERPRIRIRRVRLGNGGLTSSGELRGDNCMDVGEVDWTGGRGLQVETTGSGTSDPSSASVVLVDGNPSIGAFVMLVAGDTAEVREVRRDGALLRESLTVRHGADVMALRREGERREVCHAMGGGERLPEPRPGPIGG